MRDLLEQLFAALLGNLLSLRKGAELQLGQPTLPESAPRVLLRRKFCKDLVRTRQLTT